MLFGCFSPKKLLDKNGKETEAIMAQKASSLLAGLLKTEEMKLGKYNKLFSSMLIEGEPNQELLKFLSEKGKKGKFENVELILDLEERYPLIFSKLITNFEEVKSFKSSLDKNGKPVEISWEEAIKNFYLVSQYLRVGKEDEDIAKLFGEKGISQEVFDIATKLRRQAEANEVPEHLLGKSITEETILESIDRIKKQTEEELVSGKQIIEELYDRQFTYEWLSKRDPHNYILGLTCFCHCCATITDSLYGKKISKSSVMAQDIQNLVIRDSKGEIISKGTMYLNEKHGYAVINDFELNKKYKKHQITVGVYGVEEDSVEEQERDLIFKAFQRGIKRFIEEYDAQNPNNPIKQVNVGMGCNKLKSQVERFKKATSNLTVPYEYGFKDALEEQFILYEREEAQIENKGDERE